MTNDAHTMMKLLTALLSFVAPLAAHADTLQLPGHLSKVELPAPWREAHIVQDGDGKGMLIFVLGGSTSLTFFGGRLADMTLYGEQSAYSRSHTPPNNDLDPPRRYTVEVRGESVPVEEWLWIEPPRTNLDVPHPHKLLIRFTAGGWPWLLHCFVDATRPMKEARADCDRLLPTLVEAAQ